MTSDLEKRIRMVYPAGMLSNPSKKNLLGKEFEKQVLDAVREISESTSAVCVPFPDWWDENMTHTFHFTLDGPRYNYFMDNTEIISWMRDNPRDYAVLCLDISKVYPAYEFHFLIWEYMDNLDYVEMNISTGLFNPSWVPFFQETIVRLKQRGITQLKEHELEEEVPFVMSEDYYSIDDDSLSLIPATVHKCLFEELYWDGTLQYTGDST